MFRWDSHDRDYIVRFVKFETKPKMYEVIGYVVYLRNIRTFYRNILFFILKTNSKFESHRIIFDL